MRERIPAMLTGAIRDCCDGNEPWPLLVYGEPGVGKSAAALYLADRVKRGEVLFRELSDLCRELIDIKFSRLEWGICTVTETMYWERWTNAALCVVDEVGTRERVSDHQFETLKKAIDCRQGRPMVLISNLDLETIARLFDDRIASRLAGGTVVEVVGDDQRLRRKR